MTRVKICGITNLEDAGVAVQAGADYLGFIFHQPSPRYVAPKLVKDIVAGVRRETTGGSCPRFVGVFVNAALETVSHILDDCRLDAAQLHGAESPEFVRLLAGRAFKALRPESEAEAEDLLADYLPCPEAQYLPCFLLDAHHPALYGGTGCRVDWRMAASIAQRYPIMLAGSLTPTNVVEALEVVKPWGVDVSSGVELAKGRKDHAKVRAFVAAVKSGVCRGSQALVS